MLKAYGTCLRFLSLTAITAVIVWFMSSCANQVPPSGGPRDVTPPDLVQADPPQKTVNFNSGTIRLKFNEFFDLENPSQQILISPPLKQSPQYIIDGRSLLIKLKEKLQPNTTYTINFGEALKDYNEGNKKKGFRYVFSTGPTLDSASVSGKIFLASDNSAVEDMWVMLYKNREDSIVYKERPYYFGKTNKQGEFKLENLQVGTYKLFALKDQNFNYLFDQPNELIAYTDTPVEASDTFVRAYELKAFAENEKKTRLIDIDNPALGVYRFFYNRAVRTFGFESDLYKSGDAAYMNDTRDTFTYYSSVYDKGTARFYVKTNGTILDTLTKDIRNIKADQVKENKIAILSPPITTTSQRQGSTPDFQQDLYHPLEIKFNRIIREADLNLIRLSEDSSSAGVKADISINEKNRSVLIIRCEWKSNQNYRLLFTKRSIIDMFGWPCDEMELNFKTRKTEDYGSMILIRQIKDPGRNLLLQVTDAAGNKVYENFLSLMKDKTVIDKLFNGNYKVLVIDDINRNGKWDPGDYMQHRQSEKIFTFGDKISLKPGWEAEVQLKF